MFIEKNRTEQHIVIVKQKNLLYNRVSRFLKFLVISKVALDSDRSKTTGNVVQRALNIKKNVMFEQLVHFHAFICRTTK